MTDEHAPTVQTSGPNTFSARARAAAIASELMDRLVIPTDATEAHRSSILGDSFIEIPSTEKRTFALGHWTFQFTVNVQDTRGTPPVVWLFIEIYHKGQPDCDPVSIATFYDFNEYDCTLMLYKPLSRTNEIGLMAYNGLDCDELAASAAGYIQQYLEADPTPLNRSRNFIARLFRPADLHPHRRAETGA